MPERKGKAIRRKAAVGSLALLLLFVVPAAAVAVPDPGHSPEDRTPGVLVPGSTSSQLLGTVPREIGPAGLALHLSAAGPGADASPGAAGLLTVEVQACPGRWIAGTCAEGARSIIPPTSLDSPDGILRSPDAPSAVIPDGTELLARVTLSPAADNAVQGFSFRLTARDVGSGDIGSGDGGVGEQPATMQVRDGGRLPGAGNPDTAFRLGGLALLGAGAAAAGLAAGRWARRLNLQGPGGGPAGGATGGPAAGRAGA